jgi:hypothetical protein
MFSASGTGDAYVNNVALSCSPVGLILYKNFEEPVYNLACYAILPFDGSAWVSSSGSTGIWFLGNRCANGVQGLVGSQAAFCERDGCSFFQDVSPVPTSGTCTLSFLAFTITAQATLVASFGGVPVLSVQPPVRATEHVVQRYSVSFSVSREF